MAWTSRERILSALNHEEPDRVPLYIGSCGLTSVLGPAYPALRAHLGLPAAPVRCEPRAFQYARMGEDALRRLGGDARPIYPGPAPSRLRQDISASAFRTEWGILWEKPADSLYYHVSEAPLRTATIDDLDRFPWPDLAAPSRFAGLRYTAGRTYSREWETLVRLSACPTKR